MVYVINAQDCNLPATNLASTRNQLFTAITRSKSWIRVLGIGYWMDALIEEFNTSKEADFALRFIYPTAEQRENLRIVHRDMGTEGQEPLDVHQREVQQLLADWEAGNVPAERAMARLRQLLGYHHADSEQYQNADRPHSVLSDGDRTSDDQNFPFLDDTHRPVLRVSFPGADHISSAMRDRPYEQIYRDLAESRAYNIKMLDGALVQMTYQFVQRDLLNHRLAFFPSPSLREFENDPESYLYDELYADVVAESIVHVPMRFDYDLAKNCTRF